jgi:uncharacterized membrane protein YdfJ with MMPL/SSD domain
MASKLYRLGGWAFTHRKRMLGIWALVLVAVFAASAAFSGETNDSFEVPGTESQEAQELLETKYPEASGDQARMVFTAPEGTTLADPASKDAIRASLAEAAQGDEVEQVVDPYKAKTISEDGTIGFADVIYPTPAADISDEAKDDLEASAKPAEEAGLGVEWSGGVINTESESGSETTGIMIAFLVLAITLASLLSAGMPLITAIIGVLIGSTAITALTGVIEISETAPILAVMLGLAVGIDYSLFILSRHRQNMGEGMAPHEAAAKAVATAGSAVVFAGTTVIIALVGLTVVGIPFLTVMGLAAAGTVAVAVAIALTLTPALLGFAGERVARVNRVLGYRPKRRGPGQEKLSLRYVRQVTRHPIAVLVAGVAVLLVVAVPALDLKLGLPDDGSQPTETTQRKAYDQLTEGFGPGFNGPLTVVVDAPGLSKQEQAEIATNVTEGLSEFPGVAAVSPASQNETGELTVVQVTPMGSPSSDETNDLVDALRAEADKVQADTGIQAYVTGTTALNIDTSDTLAAALPLYVAVVVGLALLLLTVVFRSILVPVKAVAGFLLTIAASMGLTVWIFQQGHLADLFSVALPGPIVSFLPVLMIGILFGLAMDYEVFLVSSMREEYGRTGDARESVIKGYGHSGRVVVAAALIMIGVFGAYVLDPDPVVKSIGVSLAFGVFADAFIVRLTLVPAAMALLGKRAWGLPKRLERVIPEIDIEGESLEAHPEPQQVADPVPADEPHPDSSEGEQDAGAAPDRDREPAPA